MQGKLPNTINYSKEILSILRESTSMDGLSLSTITRHVFNMTACDMFYSRPYGDIYSDVQKYLRKESSLKNGTVKKATKRGYYLLNHDSKQVQQLLLEFQQDPNNQEFLNIFNI